MSNKTHQKYPRSVQHGKPRLTSLKDGWLRVPIGDLVVGVSRPAYMRDDEIYTLVTAKRSRGGIVKREVLNGKDIAVKNQFYVREDDFLISKRQIVHGACGFVPKELDGAIVSNEYLVLNFTDKIIPQFWELLSHTVYFQQVCFHSSIGVHVEKMLFKVSTWHRWEVNIPSRKEQEKIASFLGAIDTRLTQLRRKHELLQTYKRGVMQKIFSQEVRFKGAISLHFPDWEKKDFGDIVTKVSSKYDPTTSDTSYPCIELESIVSNEGKLVKMFDSKEQQSIKNKFKSGDVLFGKLRPYLRKFISANFEGVCSTEIWVFRGKKVSAKYLYYLVQTDKFYKIANVTFGSKMPRSDWDFVSSFPFECPCKEEQEKIADFLTAIDRKIEAVARQVDRTEQFKKGLLQKMFV